MAKSQNGWPVDPPRRSRLVPGTSDVRVTVADGPAGDVLMYVLAQVHRRVESLELDGARGELDDWGYASRPIRGGVATSNHASATAVDANATRHPLGAVGTFTRAQVDEIHRILAEVDHIVRWGGDYSGRKDEMHFEINANATAVARVAARLKEDDMQSSDLVIDPGTGKPALDINGRPYNYNAAWYYTNKQIWALTDLVTNLQGKVEAPAPVELTDAQLDALADKLAARLGTLRFDAEPGEA